MRILFFIVATLAVMGLGNWAYVENYKTKAALDQVARAAKGAADLRPAVFAQVKERVPVHFSGPHVVHDVSALNALVVAA